MMSFFRSWLLVSLVILLASGYTEARERHARQIDWRPSVTVTDAVGQASSFLVFKGAMYSPESGSLPVWFEKIALPAGSSNVEATLIDMVFQPVPEGEAVLVPQDIGSDVQVHAKIGYESRLPYALVSFVPVRRNSSTGKPERLVSFRLDIQPSFPSQKASSAGAKVYAASSVLASGTWYRVGVTADRVYKLSYSFLEDLGIDVQSINPRNIKVYGNGGGMLPFANSLPRKDDLVENAIYIAGENDNSFDQGDYVLFYGQGPNRWVFDESDQRFHHRVHLYSDTTYYFITVDGGLGKRVSQQASLTGGAPVTTFDDYAFHENDTRNLIRSGREWFGESFETSSTYSMQFSFPNIDASVPGYIKAEVANRSSVNATYDVTAATTTGTITGTGFNLCPTCEYAKIINTEFTFAPSGPVVLTTIAKNTAAAAGWINYIELNVRRNLVMTGYQMQFRDKLSVGAGSIAAFQLSGATPTTTVWEVTDPANVKKQSTSLGGTVLSFSVQADSLREFIAFNNSFFSEPVAFGKVENQDLHALGPVDMIIVSHSLFIEQAGKIAELHREMDSLSVIIVTPQQVYNEFSSGAQDVSAIRDFVKMFYDRAANDPSLEPRYLLLFGDGSYDNKRRFSPNSNFVPTYQSANSLSLTASYVSDDFYGLLDDNEGQWNPSDGDLVDIGIGRFPVRTVQEAEAVVDKIMNYVNAGGIAPVSGCDPEQGKSSFGSWRNTICFMADDQDGNLHLGDAEDMAVEMDTLYPYLNVDKIYLDAYQQVATSAGPRYPGARAALDARIGKGALIINYTGHGGETGLTSEGVLDISSINQWKNIHNLPLFVTATCEFSRFDDPERTTAGEYVLLSPNGGGIGLLTTVRLVYAAPNAFLNSNFYNYAFEPMADGRMPRIGDLLRLTKNASGSSVNNRNFILLGDPALRLAYPRHNVVTTQINAQPVNISFADTISALSTVTVSGYVADENGVKLTGYSGTLYPTVYDKANVITTLSNDGSQSPPYTFTLQKNILFKGRASITNGDFSFSFILPKDILPQYGRGKISYYFHNNSEDGKGSYENVIIGGIDSSAANDVTGPVIDLYMNDSSFVFGDITHPDPQLYAVITDSNGVNTAAAGLGHDMIAVLDEQQGKSIVLNDYFEADLNTHRRGSIRYPFYDLPEGRHTLSIKLWDVYNNSSQSYTEFIVATSAKLALKHVLNYPNPFTTKTKFMFEYNQACDMLDVQVQIFSVSGKVVKTINTILHADGGHVEPIEWDGTDDFGDRIGKGVYIYRLSVRNSLGEKAERYERLVILR